MLSKTRLRLSIRPQLNLTELKCQVSLLMETLQRITPHVSSPAILHSTPIVSDVLPKKTNDRSKNESERGHVAQCTMKEKSSDDDRSFSLLLTNIDCDTSEDDVRTLVHRCLGVTFKENIKVVKLVSKRMDYSLLDYISFKIMLNSKYKNIAMLPSTWPPGIRFREFRCRTIETWKPLK